MRVTGVINTNHNLCDYCVLEFPTCPKANHIKFGDGNGKGKDNVIECSECVPYDQYNNNGVQLMPEYGVIKRAITNEMGLK